jgi:hypothetical protein
MPRDPDIFSSLCQSIVTRYAVAAVNIQTRSDEEEGWEEMKVTAYFDIDVEPLDTEPLWQAIDRLFPEWAPDGAGSLGGPGTLPRVGAYRSFESATYARDLGAM